MMRQSGAVLLVCLMLLAALSLLGLAAASDHLLQERIATNLLDADHASVDADAALKWGESWLLGAPGDQRPPACPSDCGAGQVIRAAGFHGPAPEHLGEDWWRANAYQAGADPVSGTVLAQGGLAFWLAEEVHVEPAQAGDNPAPEIAWYRILSRSADSPAGTYAVSESLLARPWGDAAWTDDYPTTSQAPGFCIETSPSVPCGRVGWRRRLR